MGLGPLANIKLLLLFAGLGDQVAGPGLGEPTKNVEEKGREEQQRAQDMAYG